MSWLLVTVFFIGYLFIVLEDFFKINKAASALVTGIVCWTILITTGNNTQQIHESLGHHFGEISEILFFLLGAMTIVELIDAHDGFEIITQKIRNTKPTQLLWLIGILSFCFSAVLDNLTATIVMVSIVRKLVPHHTIRLLFIGLIVIASNAGGVWSPIGDVTTTMLWIGKQITEWEVIKALFFPALVCLSLPLLVLTYKFKKLSITLTDPASNNNTITVNQKIVFYTGLTIFLLVPVFKIVTHLPPVMGMLLGLGILWVIVELINPHRDTADKDFKSVAYALQKIDAASILFFLGILLCVAALQTAGVLQQFATQLSHWLPNTTIKATAIGLSSAVVDNVPLVASTQAMYPLSQFATDSYFWHLIAFTTGTGGSILIIGSAAGVAAMGMEKINFFWYVKKFSWLAMLGFLAGILLFYFMRG
jgi:Na+/H+ antiporter NhaD/arsenite permease-like protein